MRTVRIMALLGLAIHGAGHCQGAPLGRLFTAPDERARLDAQRRAPPPPAPVPARSAAPPASVTVDGIVRRGDGSTTVWIDQQPRAVPDTAAGKPLGVALPRESGARIVLKAGQRLDPASGEVRDVLSR